MSEKKVKPRKKGKTKQEKLTEKQQLFCLYYIKNFNATQAYLKAYGCAYTTAIVEGNRHLTKPNIRKEIQRLKKEKQKSIMLGKDDIVERFMRIAFADMTDFVEWGRVEVPVMTMFGPMKVKNPETGEEETVTREVNEVRFKDSSIIDGGLVCQVKQGKDGATIKLEDRMKALEWLADYFEMNPMNKHRRDFDKKMLEIKEKELELKTSDNDGETEVMIVDDISRKE